MNLQQAYSILDLPNNASETEAKKKFRELSKKWHPDVNKDPKAETKFKEINEAYQRIQKGEEEELPDFFSNFGSNPFSPFGFGNVRANRTAPIEPIELNLQIDFKESVLGCSKELKYSRKTKCKTCDGQGFATINNGCTKCQGKGKITVQQGNMIMVSTCPKCQGKTSSQSCSPCSSSGSLSSEVSININVPPGIENDNILRLQQMGHYAGSILNMEQYADAFCHISVVPDPDLSLKDQDVVSYLSISLLEALQGCQKSVKTIHGNKDIVINPLSKNNNEILIPNCGVNNSNNQRVILSVEYPQDSFQLINFLQAT